MSETGKIRVAQRVIELEVNDNGDKISLPVGDERFAQRLAQFVEKVTSEADKLPELNVDNIIEAANQDVKFHEMLKEEFCKVFGEDTYTKVFGSDMLVGVDFVFEFLDQITPYIDNYHKERAKRFQKYSAERTGSTL